MGRASLTETIAPIFVGSQLDDPMVSNFCHMSSPYDSTSELRLRSMRASAVFEISEWLETRFLDRLHRSMWVAQRSCDFAREPFLRAGLFLESRSWRPLNAWLTIAPNPMHNCG